MVHSYPVPEEIGLFEIDAANRVGLRIEPGECCGVSVYRFKNSTRKWQHRNGLPVHTITSPRSANSAAKAPIR